MNVSRFAAMLVNRRSLDYLSSESLELTGERPAVSGAELATLDPREEG